MHVLNAHIKEGKLILDDPLPEDLPADRPLKLTVEPRPFNAFEEILKNAVDGGMPADFSENHDKYIRKVSE